ncbi:MAG: rubrerythrin family protein [Candidatus Aenigmatarchaeota archaeon]
MSKTDENLKKAFGGESEARNKYQFFAKKAEKEGKPQIARLFRATAEAERVHARNHTDISGLVKETKENLQKAIKGENYEHSDMYPKFIEEAKEEGKNSAIRTFKWAMDVEEKHEELYKKALEAAENDEDLEEKEIYVCKSCGYTVEGEAPKTCPVCGAPKIKFKEVE